MYIFGIILNEFMQPIGIRTCCWAFFCFLRYFSAPKFDPNGNLQNDKMSKLCIPCRKQKTFFLIKVICFLGLKKEKQTNKESCCSFFCSSQASKKGNFFF